jgi:hypothetical protein
VANGAQALYNNTNGSENTATGFRTLYSNTTGSDNTGNGFEALAFNTTGGDNTATGLEALVNNTTGSGNTANGSRAAFGSGGSWNTAIGAYAFSNFFVGDSNTAIGSGALSHIGFRGGGASSNIALGYNAGSGLMRGDNNIYIGNLGPNGFPDESDTIRIGTVSTGTFIAGISGTTVPNGVAVVVDTNGQLGVASSSQRFKDEIKPMDNVSEAILALKPVTFRYKQQIDPNSIPQFGLVAEDVEKVNPDLVVRDAEGKVYTVRYEAVNAMLLNEFLKEHKKVEDLEKDLRATIVQQQKEIEALTTGLQKVSAQLELRKPAPQTVANNQ